MTPYQIKRSVLYAAIQGKITRQDPNEGMGSDFLLTNAAERKKLIQIHGLKKGKESKAFSESDYLFDIPDNWAWERFGNLVLNFDSRRKPVTKEDRQSTQGLYDYYGATGAIDRVDEYIFDGEYLMIGEDGGNFFVDRDNSFIASGKFWANNHVHVVQPVMCNIWYLKHCLDAYNLPNMGLINGIAVPKLNQENMNSIMIPVPPMEEQKRIVAKLEEILPLIDRYEAAWTKVAELNKRFPGDMQKSILQLAIQGKLVEQRPEEGTGEELFQQIQAEKQALIKAGRFKKGKPLIDICDDEIPFDIPDTWQWIRLGNIAWFLDAGKSPNCQKEPVSGTDWGVITTTSIQLGFFDDVQNKVLPKDFVVNPDMQVRQGDILITRAGPTNRTGIACLVKKIRYNLILSDKTIRINMSDTHICKDYVIMVLNSPQIRQMIMGLMSGMDKQQVNISQDKYRTLLIPLPPLAEQKRIVAKLEEILPLCDRLK